MGLLRRIERGGAPPPPAQAPAPPAGPGPTPPTQSAQVPAAPPPMAQQPPAPAAPQAPAEPPRSGGLTGQMTGPPRPNAAVRPTQNQILRDLKTRVKTELISQLDPNMDLSKTA